MTFPPTSGGVSRPSEQVNELFWNTRSVSIRRETAPAYSTGAGQFTRSTVARMSIHYRSFNPIHLRALRSNSIRGSTSPTFSDELDFSVNCSSTKAVSIIL